MQILLLLMSLWGGTCAVGVWRWRHGRSGARRDAQLRALLADGIVPATRNVVTVTGAEPRLASVHVAHRAGAAATG